VVICVVLITRAAIGVTIYAYRSRLDAEDLRKFVAQLPVIPLSAVEFPWESFCLGGYIKATRLSDEMGICIERVPVPRSQTPCVYRSVCEVPKFEHRKITPCPTLQCDMNTLSALRKTASCNTDIVVKIT
jgi:hypothetical protein